MFFSKENEFSYLEKKLFEILFDRLSVQLSGSFRIEIAGSNNLEKIGWFESLFKVKEGILHFIEDTNTFCGDREGALLLVLFAS